jgi:tetratricopeptide (TPR) repeat protein
MKVKSARRVTFTIRKTAMGRRAVIWTVLCLLVVCHVAAEEGEKPVWQQLGLESTTIGDVVVYYEECFEDSLPLFGEKFEEYLAGIKDRGAVGEKRGEIIAETAQIVGIEKEQAEKYGGTLEIFAEIFAKIRGPFYLVRKETIKGFLREGGNVPGMTYDEEDDMVDYSFGVRREVAATGVEVSKYEGSGESEMFLPIDSPDTFEKDVSEQFGLMVEFLNSGVVVHEFVEQTIFARLQPEGPYWRWFSDGFANAITIAVLDKYAGSETAERFSQAYDINEYKGLEKELNLRYWMVPDFCIRTPLEHESKLNMARYAYATYESQRLIDEHGLGCVKEILDALSQKEQKTSANLLAAIEEVTGEAMEERLGRYQTFESAEDGLKKYHGLFQAAVENQDLEQMLINVLRVLELREDPFMPTWLRERKTASQILFLLGHEEVADAAMQKCVSLFERSGIPEAHEAAMGHYVMYCLECERAAKALPVVEELLKKDPENLLAMMAKMIALDNAGNLSEAEAIAKKICELEENKQSPFYKAAVEVLTRGEEWLD